MDVQRIDGIKYDLDRLTDDEIINIRGNLLEQHARTTGEIALLEFKLFQRTHNPLPFEETPLEAMGDRPELPGFNYETFIRTVHGD